MQVYEVNRSGSLYPGRVRIAVSSFTKALDVKKGNISISILDPDGKADWETSLHVVVAAFET